MRKLKNVMVTGGAGFIGSNFIRYLLGRRDFGGVVVNVDKLTYAGNAENLSDVAEELGGVRYHFVRADVCDYGEMRRLLSEFAIDTIVHFAAESHVDRSIRDASDFVRTNIVGTFSLLEAARERWSGMKGTLFHHVSTDEVYGSLGASGRFSESTAYDPRSPYAASKAASDFLARAAHHTYALPVTISSSTNNYGPYQFPEKLIPLSILNLLEGKSVPVYGDGRNVRDWIFVDDHSEAIWTILRGGEAGRTYAVGGDNERDNLGLLRLICERIAFMTGQDQEELEGLLTFVADRPGHDRRYAIDASRIRAELGWRCRTSFSQGLDATIRWYLEHGEWVGRVRNGDYLEWVDSHYGLRA